MKTGKAYLRVIAAAAAVTVTVGAAASADAAITFLDRFNGQTDFALNSSAGDYAAGGGGLAYKYITAGNSGTGTGFFGGTDLALYTGDSNNDYLDFTSAPQNATPGIVNYTSVSSGGFSAGAWFKGSATATYGNILKLGNGAAYGGDMVVLGQGVAGDGRMRMQYFNSAGGGSTLAYLDAVPVTDWTYVEGTVDYTNTQISVYLFDKTGTLLKSTTLAMGSTPTNGVYNEVQIGGSTTYGQMFVDEANIDNEVLDLAQIQARVNSMVAGTPLAVPEPASLMLLGLGGLTLMRKRVV